MTSSLIRTGLPFLALGFVLWAGPASAAYTPPSGARGVTSEQLAEAFPKAPLSEAALFWPQFTPAHLRLALQDRGNRVDDTFRIPPGMEDHVRFWMMIYTYYSSQTLIVYDDIHPDVIYEVMDFRELAGTSRNPVVYEILRERAIEEKIRAYKKAFAALRSGKQDGAAVSPEARNILQARHGLHEEHSLLEMEESLRGQTGQRDQVLAGIRRYDEYGAAIQEVFASYKLPPELTAISLVESSFNPQAVSHAGAVGVWQFMPLSGKEYLSVDPLSGIDERRSPLKSAVAAVKLLRRNFSILDSWPLAVTSYNTGPRDLLAIPKTERTYTRIGKALTDCSSPYRLGTASRNYYAEFLAMLYAERYRDVFFGPESIAPARSKGVAFHPLRSPGTPASVAKYFGISLGRLLELNPDLSVRVRRLPRGYKVAHPAEETNLAPLLPKKKLNLDS